MTALRVTFSLLSVAAAICSAATAHTPARAPQAASAPIRSAVAIGNEELLSPLLPDPAGGIGRIDVEGNVIQDAVGDYRIDPWGETYETHSPDTAVSVLGPPGV